MASLLRNDISRKGVTRAGKRVTRVEKRKKCGILPLLALFLMMKVLRKGVTRTGKVYNKKYHMDNNF